jgi:hypothetical protein
MLGLATSEVGRTREIRAAEAADALGKPSDDRTVAVIEIR